MTFAAPPSWYPLKHIHIYPRGGRGDDISSSSVGTDVDVDYGYDNYQTSY